MTLEEWIKFYNSKTPEPFERDEKIKKFPPSLRIFLHKNNFNPYKKFFA